MIGTLQSGGVSKSLVNLLKLFRRTEFQHFYTPHKEEAFLKSTFEEIWAKEAPLLQATCTRFREPDNLNIYLMRYRQLASNRFYPTDVLSHRKTVQLHKGCLPELGRMLFDPQVKSLCLNDSTDCTFEDYQVLKPQVVALMEKKFPEKSSFEY